MFKRKKSKREDKTVNNIDLILENKPKSVAAEAYRMLRTNILYSSFDKKIKTIVVTSARPEEGKTTVSCNLALSFAQEGKKVILVDCSLRKPKVHKNFKLSNMAGLSEVLIGQVELNKAIQTRNSRLDILTSGKVPPNPSEMLSSKTMTELLQVLKNTYDIVIIDTAPVLPVTDGQVLAAKADGTILVIRANKTKKDLVVEAKNTLEKIDANIIGTVLQGIENKRGKYYSSYYYSKQNNKSVYSN